MAVSPDGKWVLTCQIQTTPPTLVLLPTGAGQPKTFPKDSIDRSASISFGAFLPDGKRIAFNGQETGKPPRVFVQDLAGGAARPVTAEGVTGRLVSPDGNYLLTQSPSQEFALVSLESAGAAAASGAAQPIRGLEPTDLPLRWAADGRSLFLASSNDTFPARVYRAGPDDRPPGSLEGVHARRPDRDHLDRAERDLGGRKDDPVRVFAHPVGPLHRGRAEVRFAGSVGHFSAGKTFLTSPVLALMTTLRVCLPSAPS